MLKSPTHVWPNRCCTRESNSPAAVRRKRRTAAKSKNRNNNRESVGPLGGRAPDRRCNPNPTSVQKELIRNCPQTDRTRFDVSTKLPYAQHDSLSGTAPSQLASSSVRSPAVCQSKSLRKRS